MYIYKYIRLCNPDFASQHSVTCRNSPLQQIKMICNKCRRYHEDHAKVSNNIRQVNYLLESTTQMEESLEKVERLAMLHKHARTNYSDLANLKYVMSARCTDVNCVPN